MAVDTTGNAGQGTVPVVPPAQVTVPPSEQEKVQRKFTDDEAAALLKETMAMKKKLKSLEDAEAKKIEDQKKASGEHQALYESEKLRSQKLENELKTSALKLAAKQAGLEDLDYLALVDMSKVTYDESFTPQGLTEAIADLRLRKPALFVGSAPVIPKTTIPTNVGSVSGPGTWEEYLKMSLPDRVSFQTKHMGAYEALVNKAKGL